ncbi:aspartate/glutamate racemase family protein [Stutzerimonas chloritidismutans]
MEPIHGAFQRLWPESTTFNLLDDSLSLDLEAAGALTPALSGRLLDLARYAESAGADAILFTCSAYGDAIDVCREQLSIPVMRPSEAMVAEALKQGSRIAVLATFEPAIAAMRDEFQAMAAAQGRSVEIQPYICAEAMVALRAGEVAKHDQLIATMAAQVCDADVLCFAQFSMTSAAEAARGATRQPVLTTPDSAVLKLRQMLAGPPAQQALDTLR